MKSIKSILAVALAAAAFSTAGATSYNGNQVIAITGSTAFRSAANNYLYSKIGSYLFATDATTTNSSSAGNLYFTNVPASTFGGTGNVDVAVYWSGSEAGNQSAACGTNGIGLVFFDYSSITNNSANTSITNGIYLGVSGVSFAGSINANSTNANTVYEKASIAFSDTKQTTSAFHGTYNFVTYHSLTQASVGIVPMGFFTENGNTLTNVTTPFVYELYSQGYAKGNLISGVLSDTNIVYFATGRFPDSGTRLTASLITKFGALASVNQFHPSASSSGAITNLNLWPGGIINGVTVNVGNNGESSGGTLCKYLTNTLGSGALTVTDTSEGTNAQTFPVGTTNHVIAYAGLADAATVTGYQSTNGPIPLAYNGVVGRCGNYGTTTALDQGYTNIINGSYPFWATEYVGYDAGTTNTGGVTAQAKSLATNMISVIKSWNSSNNYSYLAPNIPLSEMKVSRTADGGPIN